MTAPTLYRSTWAARSRTRAAPVDAGQVFRPDIAGLRAVAILLVVLYHAGVNVVSAGYVGVDIFFVISGFLITGHLAGELSRSGRISLRRFYARRMVRLLPASVLVALATLAATWHWASPLFARTVSIDALSGLGYFLNIRLAVAGTHYLDATAPPSPLQHFWSLAVEEQFYVFWPLLLAAGSLVWLRRRQPSLGAATVVLAVVGLASLALCIQQTGHSQSWAYFGLPARAWELAAGGLVALSARRLAALPVRFAALASWLGLAAVVGSAVWYTDATPFPGWAALLPVGGAALLIAGGCANPVRGASMVLGVPPMQELGRLSYSWYLWHWPILTLAPYVIGAPPSTSMKLGLVAAALVPAAMSLTAVEDRIRFHRMFRRARTGLLFGTAISVAAAAVAVVSLFLPTAVIGRGTAADTSAVLAGSEAGPDLGALTALITTSSFTTAMPGNLVPSLTDASHDFPRDGDCLADLPETDVLRTVRSGCDQHGDAGGTGTAVLFGDSHAEQWFDAVDAATRQHHLRLSVVTKGGCPAATLENYKGATAARYVECTQWREQAIAHILELKPAVIIMSARDYSARPANVAPGVNVDQSWVDAWLATVNRLKATGARLVVIADTPDPHLFSVPDCVANHPLNVRKCELSVATAFDAKRRAAIVPALTANGVRVFDPKPWFCTATACPAIIGNTLVYRDDSHISATYMKLLGPMVDAMVAG